MSRGFFVTLEGIEGCGKSTQASLLAEALRERGLEVVLLREPGSTAIGDRIRDLLLDPGSGLTSPQTEALLYAAARAQMVSEHVLPSLGAGKVVVADRYADSSIAYQCFGRGLSRGLVADINNWATKGVLPDLTLLLDLPVGDGLSRATQTGCDRIEAEAAEFHERVRRGYLELAAEQPKRIVKIDATGTVESVAADVSTAVLERMTRLTLI